MLHNRSRKFSKTPNQWQYWVHPQKLRGVNRVPFLRIKPKLHLIFLIVERTDIVSGLINCIVLQYEKLQQTNTYSCFYNRRTTLVKISNVAFIHQREHIWRGRNNRAWLLGWSLRLDICCCPAMSEEFVLTQDWLYAYFVQVFSTLTRTAGTILEWLLCLTPRRQVALHDRWTLQIFWQQRGPSNHHGRWRYDISTWRRHFMTVKTLA